FGLGRASALSLCFSGLARAKKRKAVMLAAVQSGPATRDRKAPWPAPGAVHLCPGASQTLTPPSCSVVARLTGPVRSGGPPLRGGAAPTPADLTRRVGPFPGRRQRLRG